jgi:hypothetical protein
MEEMRNAKKELTENTMESVRLEDLNIVGRMILK